MSLYHPFDASIWDDPFPTYRRMREQAPAYYLEEFDCWFLSRSEFFRGFTRLPISP